MVINELRIEQTLRQLDELTKEFQKWLDVRRRRDVMRQYYSQLNTLGSEVTGACTVLRNALHAIDVTMATDDVYDLCNEHDKRLMLIRRVWQYYRQRFDQRDDPALQAVLYAADEIVWSCYKETFDVVGFRNSTIVRGAAPLPYIESLFAPEALVRDEPPPDLKPDQTNPLFFDYMKSLPIPIIALPSACVKAPWWLIYLGHEVGHQIQYDLLPSMGLVERFGTALQDAVKAAAQSLATVQKAPQLVEQLEEEVEATAQSLATDWRSWSREIFADLCSLYSMGWWSLWAINELERAPLAKMVVRRQKYPPRAVRLALMQALATRIGLKPLTEIPSFVADTATNSEIPASLVQRAVADLEIVPHVAAALANITIADVGTLGGLYGVGAINAQRSINYWKGNILTAQPLDPEKTIMAARYVLCGAVAVWHETALTRDTAQLADYEDRFVAEILPFIRESREETTRAATNSASPSLSGSDLSTLLFQIIS